LEKCLSEVLPHGGLVLKYTADMTSGIGSKSFDHVDSRVALLKRVRPISKHIEENRSWAFASRNGHDGHVERQQEQALW
jgi:hypothetical protein